MTNVMGQIRAGAVKRADILRYMEGIAPGTNRRSHHKTLRKFWRWAHDLGHVGNDPMAKLKPLDEWGVNNEILSPVLFQRFLRVVQGLEGPMDGLEGTQEYRRLLPYLVLGGLQGLRTCEMIRERRRVCYSQAWLRWHRAIVADPMEEYESTSPRAGELEVGRRQSHF